MPIILLIMPNVMNFYMDDSGTRHPDRKPGRIPAHGHDWFGLGGILIKEKDEDDARDLCCAFRKRWELSVPLRSADIRSKSSGFAWLGTSPEKSEAFLEELYQLMADLPVVGIACVIDRPGYDHRYKKRYEGSRWMLCKTAFSVAVERAAKYARGGGLNLRVLVERGDKKTDRNILGYYEALRAEGMPFNPETSGKYAPLSADELRETLYECAIKNKSSPLIQIADLYLWPICIGGYAPDNRPYRRLKDDEKLIDCLLPAEAIPTQGIKYSCWELAEASGAKKN